MNEFLHWSRVYSFATIWHFGICVVLICRIQNCKSHPFIKRKGLNASLIVNDLISFLS